MAPSANQLRLESGYGKVLQAVDKAVTPAAFASALRNLSSSKVADVRAQFLSQFRANALERFSDAVRECGLEAKLRDIDALVRSWPASSRTSEYRPALSRQAPADWARADRYRRQLERKLRLQATVAVLQLGVEQQKENTNKARQAALSAQEAVVDMCKRARFVASDEE